VIGTALVAFVLVFALTELAILHISPSLQDVIERPIVKATVCTAAIPAVEVLTDLQKKEQDNDKELSF
jgi:hypothetical protein